MFVMAMKGSNMNVIEIIEQLVKLYCEVEAIKLETKANSIGAGIVTEKFDHQNAANEVRKAGKELIETHNF